jgi:hypothetical protein
MVSRACGAYSIVRGCMRFFEGSFECDQIPQWASFLFTLGYRWGHGSQPKRRICLVSLPCDSAAAGLIALGVMRKRMEQRDGSDKARHLERILECAKGGKSGVRIKHRYRRGFFRVDLLHSDGVWFRDGRGQSFKVLAANAYDWRFEDEPFVEVKDGTRLPFKDIYNAFADTSPVLDENLEQSDSFVCLAGRTSGELGTRAVMSDVRLEVDSCSASVAELLTVFSWSAALVSRTTFFNTRLSSFDRKIRRPEVFVADGPRPLLRLLAMSEFNESDIIGLYHRAIDRADLEEVGAKVAALQQWYKVEEHETTTEIPRGISVLQLVQR